ncbi:hypothetical protein MTP09_02130 [Chryseobacterium suipulveris]|uniref:Uncharacterized protein n=1 Tax=Chryseobacterium suipulveris TaxID=2929800 RepID=A0ABY4BUD0_9FLAO|nr:hypothetical protein [Chryseobacterium suipulveris]UOE41461.1 hypothetical protein MTP09_02130 [Chryseobacterium suipulveris]
MIIFEEIENIRMINFLFHNSRLDQILSSLRYLHRDAFLRNSKEFVS